MVGYVVFLVLCAAFVAGWRLRRAHRRRVERQMIVTNWPDIELSQRYGGWDADAYDAGTGRDHSPGHGYRTLAGLADGSTTRPRSGSWARPRTR